MPDIERPVVAEFFRDNDAQTPLTAANLNALDGGLRVYDRHAIIVIDGTTFCRVLVSSGRISWEGETLSVDEEEIAALDGATTYVWWGTDPVDGSGLRSDLQWPAYRHFPLAEIVCSGGQVTILRDARPVHAGDLALVSWDFPGAVATSDNQHQVMELESLAVAWAISAGVAPGSALVVDIVQMPSLVSIFNDPSERPNLQAGETFGQFAPEQWTGGSPTVAAGRLRAIVISDGGAEDVSVSVTVLM